MLNLLKYLDFAKKGFGVDGLTGREAYEVWPSNRRHDTQLQVSWT